MSGLRWDKAFALEQAADDVELLEELLDIFKDSFAADIDLIDKGIQTESAQQVSAAAHSIKGAAASLGLVGIYEISKIVEEDSRDGSLRIAKEKISLFKDLLEEIKNM